MASDVFKRVDLRYFATCLSENTTHAGIDTFQLGLNIETEGNKDQRAAGIVKHIFTLPDRDLQLLNLLNYLYVENVYQDTSDANPHYKQLRLNVLEPRGIVLGEDGFELPTGETVADLGGTPPWKSEPKADPVSSVFSQPPSFSQSKSPFDTGGLMAAFAESKKPPRDRSRVFIVHGRDMRPVEVLKQYLNFLGLRMMSWSDAVNLTGKTQPHTYDIVKAGMDNAAAIIVIFSPDDEARTKQEFAHNEAEHAVEGQARQNVTLEAGMAFAAAPERTIFVKSGNTREISDISGFNWVTLDGVWGSREDLKNRLEIAGASVHTNLGNLADDSAGPFKVVG